MILWADIQTTRIMTRITIIPYLYIIAWIVSFLYIMLDIRYVHLVYPYIIQCPHCVLIHACNSNMVCRDPIQTRVHEVMGYPVQSCPCRLVCYPPLPLAQHPQHAAEVLSALRQLPQFGSFCISAYDSSAMPVVVLCLVSLDSPRSAHERTVAGRSSLPWARPIERAPTNGDMYLSNTLIKFSLWLSAYKNPSFWSGLRSA